MPPADTLFTCIGTHLFQNTTQNTRGGIWQCLHTPQNQSCPSYISIATSSFSRDTPPPPPHTLHHNLSDDVILNTDGEGVCRRQQDDFLRLYCSSAGVIGAPWLSYFQDSGRFIVWSKSSISQRINEQLGEGRTTHRIQVHSLLRH